MKGRRPEVTDFTLKHTRNKWEGLRLVRAVGAISPVSFRPHCSHTSLTQSLLTVTVCY